MSMVGTLKVTPEKLIAAASQFKTQASKVRNLTNQMLSQVRNLNSDWEGEAKNAFVSKFNALDGDMAQIYMKITEHSEDLQEMATTFQQAESGIQSTVQGLKTDYIHQG